LTGIIRSYYDIKTAISIEWKHSLLCGSKGISELGTSCGKEVYTDAAEDRPAGETIPLEMECNKEKMELIRLA
jgi:hypothetical protein